MGEICCYSTLYPDAYVLTEAQEDPLYAYKVSSDPDILYLHEATRERHRRIQDERRHSLRQILRPSGKMEYNHAIINNDSRAQLAHKTT